MKQTTKFLLLFLLMVISSYSSALYAQTPEFTPEEIKSLKELAMYNEKWNWVKNMWPFFGPIIVALIGWVGFHKKIDGWIEKELTKRANEKFGVDWDTVKQLVDAKKSLLQKRALTRIAVVNYDTGKDGDLSTLFTDNNYLNTSFFTLKHTADTSKRAITDFKQDDFQILFIDDFKQSELSESDVEKDVIEPNLQAFRGKIIWYTLNDKKCFLKYKNDISFIKKRNNIIPDIDSLI